uniref:Uncharacterized protein n=1 Tax=viral metagenome TaxID=1070528 RepID=A0A6C0JU45_9ZZZZ
MLPVVYVDVGVWQPYILDNIKNTILFGNTNIHVICDKAFFEYFDCLNEIQKKYITLIDQADFVDNYTETSKLDKDFRGGFWQHCSRRFFLIKDWMNKNDIQNCYHVENDVPSYINFEETFQTFDKNKLWAPLTNPWWGVPSLMFLNRQVLGKFVDTFNPSKNDMENLAYFYHTNRDLVGNLPIFYEGNTIYSQNFKGLLFDAAAMGQYLGGVDPRNQEGDTRGFVNESCAIQNYHKHKFYWVKKDNLYVPHILVPLSTSNNLKGQLIPIANLHIHHKNLECFMADDPKEDSKFITRFEKVEHIVVPTDKEIQEYTGIKGFRFDNSFGLTLRENMVGDLTSMKEKINAGTNFSCVKFGDGEWLNMISITENERNCDGNNYFRGLGDDLVRSYIFFLQNKDTLISRWTDQVYNLEETLDKLYLIRDKKDNKFVYYDLLIHKWPFVPEQIDLFKSIRDSGRTKVYISNEPMVHALTSFLNIGVGIVIPPINCYLFREDIISHIKKAIQGDNAIVLFSAGMASKVLVWKLMIDCPNNTYIDIGSTFDGLVRVSRDYNSGSDYRQNLINAYK